MRTRSSANRMADDDEDDEYEEETVHVLLDLGDAFSVETLEQLAKEKAEIQILDLESGKPYIKIGEGIFRGNLDDLASSNLLFEVSERERDTSGLLPLLSTMRNNSEEGTPQTRQNATFQRYSMKYMGEADKVISCQRVTLVPKKEHEMIEKNAMDTDNDNIADLLQLEDEPME